MIVLYEVLNQNLTAYSTGLLQEILIMTQLKKFSYSEISRRWMIHVYSFILFFTTVGIISNAVISCKEFLPYYNSSIIILVFSIFALFAGNLTGRLLYRYSRMYILINTVLTVLFSLSVVFYFFKHMIFGSLFLNFELYIHNRYLLLLIILLPQLFSGMINTYLLKVCSGDFVDDKNLTNYYYLILFSSISLAIITSITVYYKHIDSFLFSLISTVPTGILIILAALIRIPYLHEELYAKHYPDEEPVEEKSHTDRDDLLFTYSSFSFIIIYIFLGYIAYIKFFNNSFQQSLAYTAAIFLSIICGYITGLFNRHTFWYVYSEMLYPAFFISSLFLLYYTEGKCDYRIGLMITSIPGLIFGFSLSSTVFNITEKYDHQKRFNILNYSLLILPFPILTSLSFLHFTGMVFFVILYAITVINILVPGIYLFSLKTSYVKKTAYFLLTLAFIPVIILFHFYYKIPVDARLFHSNIENFELLKETNYNLPYVSEKGEVSISGQLTFYLSESTIRNHKRAVASSLLFINPESRGLIIDANQKFFRNPLFGIFTNCTCLDIIPDYVVDWNRLPESGRQLYQPIETELLNFMADNEETFDFIIDYPNILDQNNHSFRYRADYYSIINKKLNPSGKYFLILDIQHIKPEQIYMITDNLSESFKYHSVFLFSGIMLIASSNNPDSISIDSDSIKRIEQVIDNEKTYSLLFYSSVQPLNSFITSNIKIIKNMFSSENNRLFNHLTKQFEEFYLSSKQDFSLLILKEKLGWQLRDSILSSIARQRSILSLIKNTEYAESIDLYENETEFLFQLKRYSAYNSDLKSYIDKIFTFKEKFYLSEAFRLEKEKRWDEAITLYKAILTINPENFEANYRFGLLYITIQDIDKSFKYLETALKLNKEHPQVLYQMGVLMFSSNKIKEAISYFEKAREQKLNIYQLYMYLGLCYEQLGSNEKAKEYYEQALLLDPNDTKLRSLLNSIEEKIKQSQSIQTEGEKTNMLDDEQGVKVSIPVNKKAVKARLPDEE